MGMDIYLRDEEVARLLRISTFSLQRIARGFVRGGEGRKTHAAVNRVLAEAEPETVGGTRLWRVDKLAKVLDLTVEQIAEAVRP